jgi:hypothetical protein
VLEDEELLLSVESSPPFSPPEEEELNPPLAPPDDPPLVPDPELSSSNVVAPLVSSLFVVVLPDEAPLTPRDELLAAKSPPEFMLSPARESEVTVPGFSFLAGMEERSIFGQTC